MRIKYDKDTNHWIIIDERGILGEIYSEEAAHEFERMLVKSEDLGVCLPGVVETLEEKEVDVDSLAQENSELREHIIDLEDKIVDLRDFITRIFEEMETLKDDYEEEL